MATLESAARIIHRPDTLVAELERAFPNFPKLDRLAAMVRG